MNIDVLRQRLLNGAVLLYSKHLNEKREVRACYAIVFDRRKGFHVIEQRPKQLRPALESGCGVYMAQLVNEKIVPVGPCGEESLPADFPEEQEQDVYQLLARHDFTAEVQEKKLLRKLNLNR